MRSECPGDRQPLPGARCLGTLGRDRHCCHYQPGPKNRLLKVIRPGIRGPEPIVAVKRILALYSPNNRPHPHQEHDPGIFKVRRLFWFLLVTYTFRFSLSTQYSKKCLRIIQNSYILIFFSNPVASLVKSNDFKSPSMVIQDKGHHLQALISMCCIIDIARI